MEKFIVKAFKGVRNSGNSVAEGFAVARALGCTLLSTLN